MKKYQVLVLCLLLATIHQNSYAQIQSSLVAPNLISTAVPFLQINPDTETAGMGDVGIATRPGLNAIFWNSAKLPFVDKQTGSTINFTRWKAGFFNPLYLLHLGGYYQISGKHTIGGSFRYFDLGQFYPIPVSTTEGRESHEFAADLAYGFKVSDNLGLGVNVKYIVSDLRNSLTTTSGVTIQTGKSFATDLSLYYQNKHKRGKADALFSSGLVISNIGPKLSYIEDHLGDPLPTNLGVGLNYDLTFGEVHGISAALDLNKLLVPTPSYADVDNNGVLDYREKTLIGGMLSSFGDAQNEFAEVRLAAGLEYMYDQLYAVRVGVFQENKYKGNRNYVTLGGGWTYKFATLDLAYILTSRSSSLQGIYRVGLSFEFDEV